MANVNIKFNNKDYLLSCDDGQEESLKKLTKFLDKKYSELKDKLGNIGENKLLLITTIQLIDEYFDLKKRITQQKLKLDEISKKFKEIRSLAIEYKKDKDKPLSFVQAASFQLINPKGIMVIISSVSAYTSTAENVGAEVTILLFVFAIVTLCAACTWTVFGTGIAQLLTSHTRLRQFNVTMALLLVASLLPSILEPALMK